MIGTARRVARHLGVRLPRARLVQRTRSVAYLRWATRSWQHRLHRLERIWARRLIGIHASRHAASQVGVPYVWGAESPGRGFDCSGLVQWAYRSVGLHLPRTTYSMIRAGHGVGRAALRAGDLVFAYGASHVGLYVGHGTVVDAPHPGADVRRSSIGAWPLTAARRVI